MPRLNDGEQTRPRYGGIRQYPGFALYLASIDEYQDATLPPRGFVGTPEDALGCACGTYPADPGI